MHSLLRTRVLNLSSRSKAERLSNQAPYFMSNKTLSFVQYHRLYPISFHFSELCWGAHCVSRTGLCNEKPRLVEGLTVA